MLPRGKRTKKGTLTFQDHILAGSSRIPWLPARHTKSTEGSMSPCAFLSWQLSVPRGPHSSSSSSSSLHAGVLSCQGFLPLCFFLPVGAPGQTSACPHLPAGSSGGSRAGEPSGAWGSAVLGARSFLAVQKPTAHGCKRTLHLLLC